MKFSYLFVFILYFLTIFSVIGFGKFLSNFFIKKEKFNFGYYGIFGLFFLTIYSYISHVFYPHTQFHNTILLIIGLISFIYFLRNRSKEIIFTSSIFLLLFISLVIFKTHDDFPYYHFGYSHHLNQTSLVIGIGQFNHGFRTPSSIFYLNSLFYFPLIKFYFFHLSAVLFLGFVNIIFLNGIIQNLKGKKFDFKNYFALLSFAFINIFFYRIAEHGTDRSAQILIFLLFYEIFFFQEYIKFHEEKLFKIFVILGLVISLKAFFVLYLIILIPIFYFLIQKISFKSICKKLLVFPATYLLMLIVFLVVMSNFLNTACIIYPVSFTCFEDFSWSFLISDIEKMNDWYEQWSKGGAAPNFRVENPEVYIQGFNWVTNWFNLYFFNKVSDFLVGILILMTVFYLLLRSKNIQKIRNNKLNNFLYFILLLLFLEWFYNHPALRYGGFVLLSSIFFIPFSIYLSKFKIKNHLLKKRVSILIFITLIVFLGRNVDRINNEIQKYNYEPFKDINFRINDHHFRNIIQIQDLLKNYKSCVSKINKCDMTKRKKIEKFLFIYKIKKI